MRATVLESIADLAAAEWERLDTDSDPFVSRDFLLACERHGAASPKLGWHPHHLQLRTHDGRLAGFLPCYRREHSFGDFSRDWNWPEAWHRAGLAYYPKLVSGIPYTPSTGPRLLVARDVDGSAARQSLVAAACHEAGAIGASGWQLLFAPDADASLLEQSGLLFRRGTQFHWRNDGYATFADFLATLSSKRRKEVRRERRQVADANVRVEVCHGGDIDDERLTALHRHYRSTFHRYGNHPAFSAAFFRDVSQALGQRFVVFLAWRERQSIASAICYRSDKALFGRHWGCDEDIAGLHFELCFYQGIDYCIREGLTSFEPGAGGEHKIARGFAPASTLCAYWIADPRMREALGAYLARENTGMEHYRQAVAGHLPFRTA